MTVCVDQVTGDEYRTVLDRRLAQAALPGRPHSTLADDAVEYLRATFGADRRAAERLLYEVFQQLRAPAVVTADRLREAGAAFSAPGVVS